MGCFLHEGRLRSLLGQQAPHLIGRCYPNRAPLRCLYSKTKSHVHAHTCAHILTWTQSACDYTNTYMHGPELIPVCTDNICTHVPAHISTHTASGLLPAGVSVAKEAPVRASTSPPSTASLWSPVHAGCQALDGGQEFRVTAEQWKGFWGRQQRTWGLLLPPASLNTWRRVTGKAWPAVGSCLHRWAPFCQR